MLAPNNLLQQDAAALEAHRSAVVAGVLKILPAMRRYAWSLAGSVDGEDLVQYAVAQAIDKAEQFKSGTSLASWVTVIIRNEFYTAYRRAGRTTALSDTFADDVRFSTRAAGDARCECRDVLRTLACMPRSMRDALIAIRYLGLSYKETATLFGVIEGTIKSRVHRGHAALLRQEGRKDGYDDALRKIAREVAQTPRTSPRRVIANAYAELYGVE